MTGDAEAIDKFNRRLIKVTKTHAEEAKRLLQLMGIPYIDVSATLFEPFLSSFAPYNRYFFPPGPLRGRSAVRCPGESWQSVRYCYGGYGRAYLRLQHTAPTYDLQRSQEVARAGDPFRQGPRRFGIESRRGRYLFFVLSERRRCQQSY